MNTDPYEELDAGEQAALELVEHVRRMEFAEMELPILDESCMWLVSVKRLGIRDDG